MPTISEAMKEAFLRGKSTGVLALDLRLLVMHNENFKDQIDVLYYKDKPMLHYDLFQKQVDSLIAGEPVEYIINETQFLGHRLYIDKDVLIPRSETEELVANITEKIGDYYDPRNYLVVADIGTGSGAIALALKEAFPNWLITASDISEPALRVAKKNFALNSVSVSTLEGDALKPFIEEKMALDIIVSNPPYITDPKDAQASVRDYEPASALWMDKNDSVYEKIFRDVHLVKKGSLFLAFEISPELDHWLEGLMQKYLTDYEYEFIMDLNKMKRFLFVYLK
jgi:release factor glutamine methyltransferase